MAESRTPDYEKGIDRISLSSIQFIRRVVARPYTSGFSTEESSAAPVLTSAEPEGWPTLWREQRESPLLGHWCEIRTMGPIANFK
jgi:hypothetical protein